MKRHHTDRKYDAELKEVRERIVLMGQTVDEMIRDSIRALVERDSGLARRTIEQDHRVNQLEVDTDDLCLRILARRHPVASDLRFITTALKAVTDIERIGDLCVNICERSIELNQESQLGSYKKLSSMAEAVQEMLREALDALVEIDADRASRVIEQDRTVDVYYAEVFRELLTRMIEDPHAIHRATRIQAIGKNLERIGDHVTNLAELVIFLSKGKDVRHLGRLEHAERRKIPHGILFLCVHNAARSQMAEGWARKLLPAAVRIWSAGSQPADKVHPNAVQVMGEVGIDISEQRPKLISDVPHGDVDTVVTLCSEEVCVSLPRGTRQEDWIFPDPAGAVGDADEILSAFRRIRDGVREKIETLLRP
jgi:phosphate transport system protein